MREKLDLPTLPEYVSIKEAAQILGVSDKRVYAYVEEERLPAVRAAHVIMIPLEEVRKFKPNISGRPRKNTPLWRTSPIDNIQLTTSIHVQIVKNQQETFQQRLQAMRQNQKHIFPGTIARYIIGSTTHQGTVEILLIWRSSAKLNTATRKKALEAFQHVLSDVLDWDHAYYQDGEVLLHAK